MSSNEDIFDVKASDFLENKESGETIADGDPIFDVKYKDTRVAEKEAKIKEGMPKDQPVTPESVMDTAAKVGVDFLHNSKIEAEALLMATVGIAGSIAGGVAGAATLAGHKLATTRSISDIFDSDKIDASIDYASNVMRKVQSSVSYTPSEQESIDMVETLTTPFVMWDNATSWVSDKVYDVSGRPSSATATKVGLDMVSPLAFLKGSILAARSTANVVNKVKSPFNNESVKTKAQEEIELLVDDAVKSDPKVKTNVQEGLHLEENVDGLKFTLGELMDDSTAISTQQNIARFDQAAHTRAKTHKGAQRNALDDYAKDRFGSSDGIAAKILKESKGDVRTTLSSYTKKLEELEAKEVMLTERINKHNIQSIGNAIEKLRVQQYELAKARVAVLYDSVGEAKVPMRNVWDTVDSFVEDLTLPDGTVPLSVTKILKDRKDTPPRSDPMIGTIPGQKGPDIISLDRTRGILSTLSSDIARFKAVGDENTVRVLTVIKSKIEGGTGKDGKYVPGALDMVKEVEGKAAIKMLRQAKDVYKKDIVDRFNVGMAYRMKDVTKRGEASVPAEDLVRNWFKLDSSKGNLSTIEQFRTTFGSEIDNPAAWQALHNGITYMFAKHSIDQTTGVLNVKKANAWLARHEEGLNMVPEMRRALKDTAAQAEQIQRAKTIVDANQTIYKGEIMSKLAKTDNPQALAESAIKDKNVMLMVNKKLKGNPDAQQGWARFLGNHLLKTSVDGKGTIISHKLLKNIEDRKETLLIGMGPKHYGDLTTYAAALKRVDSSKVPEPTKAGGVTDVLKDITGTTSTSYIAQARAISQGRDSEFNLIVRSLIGFGFSLNKRAISRIEQEALYNPDVARIAAQMTKYGADNPPPQSVVKVWRSDLMKYGIIPPVIAEGAEDANEASKRFKNHPGAF